MLTARLPFWGSLTAILRAIPCDEPARPSSLVPAVGHDSLLERVCLKMLAKSPADRFPSMTAVAETLVPTTGSEEKAPPKRSWWQRLWPSSSPKSAASPVPPQRTVAGEVADDNSAFEVSAPHPKPPAAASLPPRPAAKPPGAPAAPEHHEKTLRDSGEPPPASAADPDNLPTADFAPPPKS
jgi:hypothetical protein